MTYLYTNPPFPALVSPVKYLWHGKVTSANRPLLQAVPVANGGVSVQVSNCPPGATNYLERSLVLDNPSAWQTVFSFNSPPVQTNWTDPTAPNLPQAFYRVRSASGP
jgi:hypothetical protein